MTLWRDKWFYEQQMEPDEEAAWAEHDQRCGHTPAPGLNTFIFSPARREGASSASGSPLPCGPDAPPSDERTAA